MRFFMIEEPLFPRQSSPISDEFATLSDDSMAGDDDDDRVMMVGSSYSSDSFRIPDHRRLFEVASRLSIGDRFERFPCFYLEISTTRFHWYSKFFSRSCEVFSEFFFHLLKEDSEIFAKLIMSILRIPSLLIPNSIN